MRALSAMARRPPGLRAPGARERARARRRRVRAERRTWALGVGALALTAGVLGTELARVWRRGDAPLPGQEPDVFASAEGVARQTFEVAVVGYREGSITENALFTLLTSFTVSFAMIRASTHSIRARGTFGPFRPLVLGERRMHIHHFVPGIVLALVAGGASILTRDERLDPILAIPFGIGAALTLDESALLLKLDDVYWTEEGIVSVQISLAALAMVSALALAMRVLRRGEQRVLAGDGTDDDA
jgi:hypothetical protein